MQFFAYLDDGDWAVPTQPNTSRLLEGHVMLIRPEQLVDREPRLMEQVLAPTALVVLANSGLETVRIPVTLVDVHGGRYRTEVQARIIQYGRTRVRYQLRDLWLAVAGNTGEARGCWPRRALSTDRSASPHSRPTTHSPPRHCRRLGSENSPHALRMREQQLNERTLGAGDHTHGAL